MNFVCSNGTLLPKDEPVLLASNRSFRYGDGLFETLKIVDGKLPLAEWHYDRLFRGLRLLKINASFFEYQLTEWIIELAQRNGCLAAGRVRLAVFREGAGAGFLIEAEPLDAAYLRWNDEGLSLGLYTEGRKPTDAFANIKSANYLWYVMADLFAKDLGVNDCLVLNAANGIADASRANLFIISRGELYTPGLHQGGVDGVMRRYLVDALKRKGYLVHQEVVTEKDLLEADEVFLTNALYGIRWVARYKGRHYGNELTREIYDSIISTI